MNDNKQDLKPVEYPGFGRVEDSRLKGYRGTITHPTLPLERTFCTKCGKPYGWTSTESSQLIAAAEVIVICEDCEENMRKLGPIPFMPAAPKEATEIPPLKERIKNNIKQALQVPLPRKLGD